MLCRYASGFVNTSEELFKRLTTVTPSRAMIPLLNPSSNTNGAAGMVFDNIC